MIIINGKIISGNHVTINGRGVVEPSIGESKTFDEKKSENSDKIEKIKINSESVNIHISGSNSSKVTAHLHGKATVDGQFYLDFELSNSELKITVRYTGNYYIGGLSLDITVPYKIFKVIFAKTISASITLDDTVSTNFLKLKTTSGSINTSSEFSTSIISSISGTVELFINARQNITTNISTVSGYVSAEFNNISYINLNTESISGKVRNIHKPQGRYTADVKISTISGSISIR